MLEILQDTLLDSVKLLPFLFIAYLIMEYIEHKMENHTHKAVKKAGKWGPVIGGILGILPQCGFSVAATNFFAARMITIGTLMAVYLATSDEMIPIFLSEAVPISVIAKILVVKLGIAILVGVILDTIFRKMHQEKEENIEKLCEDEHCHCEKSIVKSSLRHTFHIFIFIFIISFLLQLLVTWVGEENVSYLAQTNPVLAPIVCCLVALIPNCAASVILTQLFLEGVIPVASMLGGLLVNAGVGLAVLFRVNKDMKQNFWIIGILLLVGIISAYGLQAVGIQNWIVG